MAFKKINLIIGLILLIFLMGPILFGIIPIISIAVIGAYIVAAIFITERTKLKPPISYFMIGLITALIPQAINIFIIQEFDIIIALLGSVGNGIFTLIIGLILSRIIKA